MKQSAYERARDQRIADDVTTADYSHRCPAHGCPLRWSVIGERGKACSAHYWADPIAWPAITDRLLREETDRSLARGNPPPPSMPITREQRRALAERMAKVGHASDDPLAWAWRLHARHQAGDKRLTHGQIQTYRQALGRRLDPQDEVA